MFNKIYLLAVCAGILLIVASCNDNPGYMVDGDLKEVNEVQIAGMDSTYSVLLGEKLTIKPELSFTNDNNSNKNRYEYGWYATRSSNRWMLGDEKNLDATITLSPAQDYQLVYEVTDTQTGITKTPYTAQLIVETEVFEGWLVLSGVNGKARLDMISLTDGDYSAIHDVLEFTSSDLELEGAPVDVSVRQQTAVNPEEYRIYVTAEGTGTTRLNPDTFEWDPQMYISFEGVLDVPTDFAADFVQQKGLGSSYMYKDGDFYYYNWLGNNIRWGEPINIFKDENETFRAAPYVTTGLVGGSFNYLPSYNSLIYDMDNQRFALHERTKEYVTELPAQDGAMFNPDDMGMDLTFMTGTTYNGGEVFAILKDPNDSSYHLARMSEGSWAQAYWDKMSATNIEQAENFAVSPEHGYVFYNVGSTVYQYDTSNKQTKIALDKGSEKITFLRFQQIYDSSLGFGNRLIVGSYSPSGPAESNGTVSFYTVPPVFQDLELDEEYMGFGRVKDITYRDRLF